MVSRVVFSDDNKHVFSKRDLSSSLSARRDDTSSKSLLLFVDDSSLKLQFSSERLRASVPLACGNECFGACVSIGPAWYATCLRSDMCAMERAGTGTCCMQIEQIDQRFSSHALWIAPLSICLRSDSAF